ncbi:MAG: type II secretion system F family protein [Patescibacteria group bacterium]
MNSIALKIKNISWPKISFGNFNYVRLSLQEQALFAKRMSMLIKAGVSMFESITMIGKGTKSAGKRKMFEQIAKDIAHGQFLSKSLAKWRKTFGNFAINIIYVGETTGTLSENLRYLAVEIEKKRRLKAKVVGALVYPCIIMVAALAVSGLMTAYLFPKLMPIFQSLNVTLPFTTRALLWLSNFLIHYWHYLFLGIALAIGAFFGAMRLLKPFRYFIHAVVLRIPFMGSLLTHYYIVNICRTFGILFKSQVRIVEAVEITAATCGNLVYRRAVMGLRDFVIKGGTISKCLETNRRLFPHMLCQMIYIGETTGNLSDTLMHLGEIYEEELDEQTKRLSSVIEPFTMIIMGILVGFIAISIITPIYEVTQHLNPR